MCNKQEGMKGTWISWILRFSRSTTLKLHGNVTLLLKLKLSCLIQEAQLEELSSIRYWPRSLLYTAVAFCTNLRLSVAWSCLDLQCSWQCLGSGGLSVKGEWCAPILGELAAGMGVESWWVQSDRPPVAWAGPQGAQKWISAGEW